MKFRTFRTKRDGQWAPVEFEQLRAGDIFRVDEMPGAEYQAKTNPEPCDPPGNWSLQVDRVIRVIRVNKVEGEAP